jgi:aspartate/methionine/tyrosine aminotransferase
MRLEARERLLHLFEERIYTSSLKDLSGWDRAALGVHFPDVHLSFSGDDLRRYIFDRELPNNCLEIAKQKVANLMSLRELAHLEPCNILLTPGATAAISVIAHYLKSCGVRVLITDPPFYFSVKKLCDALGIQFFSAAKSIEEIDDYRPLFRLLERFRNEKKALILTNPKYVISCNYPEQVLAEVAGFLSHDDHVIIDKSVDMEFSRPEESFRDDVRLIKIRTIGKSISINGSRLATIIAGPEVIARLNRHASILYGSLDIAMLKLGSLLADNPDSFKHHLLAIKSLVEENVLEARLLLGGTPFEVAQPENGFLSYVNIDTSKFGRFVLYQSLLRESVHAMFSAHIGLRQLYSREIVRVNYLLDIRAGLMALGRVAATHIK